MVAVATFPPMEAKPFERLPQVFQWIINADRSCPALKSVVSVKEWLEWKEYRRNLSIGAQNVIKKQRGDGGGASSG